MSLSASQTAFTRAAPPDERQAALQELQATHLPSASDLLPRALLDELVGQFRQESDPGADQNANLDPLFKSNQAFVPFPSTRAQERKPGMQSVVIDEFRLNINCEYWERPSLLSFDALRMMVEQTPVLNAVMLTRIHQVQRFCRVAESGNDAPGFEIHHIDRAHHLDKNEQASMASLSRFMSNCGWEFRPRARKALRRDALAQFMAKSVRDTLTMDSAPIELEWKRDRSRGMDGFYAVDGATIRLCSERGYHGNDEIFALQVIEGRISTAYSFEDLIYESRNPRTDVTIAGYGLSETELLVRVVTGFLNALSYNIKGFDSNAIPKGMLHLSGNYSDKDLQAFKRYWNSMVRGINNPWSLPVMVSKDQESRAAFERFDVEFNEMYFSKWMTFLTSIICAVYGMSPAEINFDSFSGGTASPLSGSDTEQKLTASKDSGLRPLLAYYENLFTDHIVSEFSDKYVFRWTGLDPEDVDKKHEKKKLILNLNQMLAEEGYPAIEGPFGEIPLNPSLIQPWMAINQIGQPQDLGARADADTDPDSEQGEAGEPSEQEDGDRQDTNEQTDDQLDTDVVDDTELGKAFGLPPLYSLCPSYT